VLVTPPFPLLPPEMVGLLAPPPFDWQPGASNAKAAKAAPDAKCV
jgi:hypothetical protein